jgi:hypothetical protein
LEAALGMWTSSSKQVKSDTPQADASVNTIIPLELMSKSDKNLPDKTVPDPF